ncbi:MAG: flagellar basal body P-ring formation protein FlgA [Limnobacter sp.]|nr:flagellar basal body P-ring formation protein FlgA [Limnobacter sp.]
MNKTLVLFSALFLALYATSAVATERWVKQADLASLVPKELVPKGATLEVELQGDERIGSTTCPVALFSNASNNRLWGKTFLQVQCLGSDQPPFFVTVHIRLWAPVLVVRQTAPSGEPIGLDAVEFRTMDLTQLNSGYIDNLAALDRKVAARQLFPGALLKPDHLKGRSLLKYGDTVKVVVGGPGFKIAGTATALEAAEQGDIVKIKTPNGKILHGMAVDDMLVEVTL